jgi:tetratricopeptide (TPR) repeat protein
VIAVTVFGIWAMNSYASFWIRRNAPDTQLQLALDAMAQGRKEESLQHYAAAVRGAPRNIKIKALLVRELAPQRETAQIKAIATEALKDPIADGDDHCFLANILGADGQWDAAIAEARRSIDLAPDNPNAHNGLCEWLCRSERFAEAISAGREAERINPFDPNLQFNMGYAFSSLHDETNALVHLRLAASLNPIWAEAHDRLGICLIALQQYADATNQFAQAMQLRPDNIAFRFHLASAFAFQGDTAGETDQYRQILKAAPKSVLALNALAWRLATGTNSTLGDGIEAIPLALRACELTESKEAQFLQTLAAAYARAGLFEEATATAEQAMKLAERASETERVASIRNLLEQFRSGTPYTDQAKQPLVALDTDFEKRK